jgi:hypothetical protein
VGYGPVIISLKGRTEVNYYRISFDYSSHYDRTSPRPTLSKYDLGSGNSCGSITDLDLKDFSETVIKTSGKSHSSNGLFNPQNNHVAEVSIDLNSGKGKLKTKE